ncbi:MAG: hypothetical protein AB7S46_14740, partial [Flavobacteriaceae bacterium]
TVVGSLCLVAAIGLELYGHWQSGLRPAENAYSAMVYMAGVVNGQLVLAVFILAGFAAARHVAGRLDRDRRVSFDNMALLHYYTAGQFLFSLLLVHGFPPMVN